MQTKANNAHMGKTAIRLLRYIVTTYKLQFVFVLIAILISALANVAGIMFIKYLIDGFVVPLMGRINVDYSSLLRAIILMAIVYYGGVVATYIYNRLMINISQGVLKRIRDDMFTHMQSLPIRYFDTNLAGDIMSRYTNDTDTLRQMISQALPACLASLVTVLSIIISMVFTDIPLTLLVAMIIGVMFLIVRNISGKSAKYFSRQQKAIGLVDGFVEEMLDGQKVVKVFCYEEKAKENFDKLNHRLRDASAGANRYANILMPSLGNMGNIMYLLVSVCGCAIAISGLSSITLGGIASFLQMTRNMTQPIGQISQQLNAIIMALAGAQRIFELLDEKPETDDGYVMLVNADKDENGNLRESPHRTGLWAWKHPHSDGTLTYQRMKGDVVFDDVDFGYTDEKIVLHNISLYAKPGQKIAFVGATGAGKTTITNLINRFYDVQDGKIRYDGININKIKKGALRRSLGMVLQDTHLFTGTVMENIRFGKPDATDDEVIAASKLANAHQFIKHLPGGYQTVISGDGASLSQGQCQLLSIARAAVADPPVLVLDEATSSIDTRTESIVQKGMDHLMKGRTVFVIAHRLSTIKNADVIMVMDGGRIIERGNHESLMEEKGKYYQLYTGAFELS